MTVEDMQERATGVADLLHNRCVVCEFIIRKQALINYYTIGLCCRPPVEVQVYTQEQPRNIISRLKKLYKKSV